MQVVQALQRHLEHALQLGISEPRIGPLQQQFEGVGDEKLVLELLGGCTRADKRKRSAVSLMEIFVNLYRGLVT